MLSGLWLKQPPGNEAWPLPNSFVMSSWPTWKAIRRRIAEGFRPGLLVLIESTYRHAYIYILATIERNELILRTAGR